MSRVAWQPSPLITNAAPGTLPAGVQAIVGKIDTLGEDTLHLNAKVTGSGSIMVDVYVWNGTEYVSTRADYMMDATYPYLDLPAGQIYAIWVYETRGTVTAWEVRYGLETQT